MIYLHYIFFLCSFPSIRQSRSLVHVIGIDGNLKNEHGAVIDIYIFIKNYMLFYYAPCASSFQVNSLISLHREHHWFIASRRIQLSPSSIPFRQINFCTARQNKKFNKLQIFMLKKKNVERLSKSKWEAKKSGDMSLRDAF